MTAKIMDGKKIAEEVKANIKREVDSLRSRGVSPCLATILIGDDPASQIYVRLKHKSCEEVGIVSKNLQLPPNAKQEEVIKLIESLNEDSDVHGILIQLPIPGFIDGYELVERIHPDKDVDGLHPYNSGKASYKKCDLIPCTPKGIMAMLAYYKIDLEGKHAVIINRSNLVGKPLYSLMSNVDPLQMLFLNTDILLLNSDATVTVCHSKTRNLPEFTRDADILVSAVGRRQEFIVTQEMVKDGAVVIDVGVSKIEGKLCGDVDFEEVAQKASYITPVPGGVGPMTVAMLLHNTLIASAKQVNCNIEYDLSELWKFGKR